MFELKDEQKQIQSLARELALGEILPGAQARDRSHEFPTEIVQQLAQMGFMGMFIPEQYGGAGLDVLSYVLALEQVSYADAGVGVIMSVNNSLASWPILRFGTEEQKQKYLVPLARGDKLGCYALTEPGAGSDAGAQKTRITKDGDHYVLNGTKMWITNGPQADVCVAYASLDPEQRHRAVCAFVLERTMPGYRVGKLGEKLGIHCSSTSEILFEDLRVPKANLLHKEGEGFKVAMATLDGGRI